MSLQLYFDAQTWVGKAKLRYFQPFCLVRLFYYDIHLVRLFIKTFIWWELVLRLLSSDSEFKLVLPLLAKTFDNNKIFCCFDKCSCRLYHLLRLFTLRLSIFLWTQSTLYWWNHLTQNILILLSATGCSGLKDLKLLRQHSFRSLIFCGRHHLFF